MGRVRAERSPQSSNLPDYEERIKAAILGVSSGHYKSYRKAAKAEGVHSSPELILSVGLIISIFQVVQQTLMNQVKGLHGTRAKGRITLRLLTPVQEEALIDWCRLNSSHATPLHSTNLRARAFQISGKHPGKHWASRFIQHHPCLVSAKPRGLDPKRAQNFNRTVVAEYFGSRQQLEERYGGIPPEHHWNMDEKGCQMGGGRQGSGMKFIFASEDSKRYRLHSDNLELVSIIECVNAAGTAMPPAFILKDSPIADHSDVEGIGA